MGSNFFVSGYTFTNLRAGQGKFLLQNDKRQTTLQIKHNWQNQNYSRQKGQWQLESMTQQQSDIMTYDNQNYFCFEQILTMTKYNYQGF